MSVRTERVRLPIAGAISVPLRATGGPGDPLVDPLVDPSVRRVRYLRVSVTDRCNYRCAYCMPDDASEPFVHAERRDLLSFEEISRIVTVFARLGVRKVRLTGGEPTVRAHLVELVRMLATIPGLEQIALTTNGHLLADLAAPLVAAGVTAVNISLDTLDAVRFRAITGRGDLAHVVAGIDSARATGVPLKLNAVALRGVNDGELAALCRFAWAHGAVPRFIEHMPMSAGAHYAPTAAMSAHEIRAEIAHELGTLTPVAAPRSRDAGPARYWRVDRAEHSGEVGIISAMTEHFCDDCNRVRLTASGELHACLGHDDAISLRDLAREGGTDDDLVAAIAAAVSGKRAGHSFATDGGGGPRQAMIGIGG